MIVSTAVEGRSYAEGAQRDSDAIPLRVPACRLHAVEQLTSVFAPVNYWRKGLLRFWLTADLYLIYSVAYSQIFSLNFYTITNLVKPKLTVNSIWANRGWAFVFLLTFSERPI